MTQTALGWRFGLLLVLWLAGCASSSVAWLQPRADGSVELVLFAHSRSPNLGIKSGGAWTIDDVTEMDERVLWTPGVPPRFVGKSRESSAPLFGLPPRYFVPLSLCSPPSATPARSAVQREGESLIYCLWKDDVTESARIEARLPFQDPPLLRQVFPGPKSPDSPGSPRSPGSPDSIDSIEPLPGQRALLSRGGRLWLLDVRAGTVQLVLAEPASLRGATPEGDLLLWVEGHHYTLLLRSRKVVVLGDSVRQLAVAAGSLWLQNEADKRLLRVDPDAGTLLDWPRPKGCLELLGADRLGNLWFSSEPSPVRRGTPLPLCRWNPSIAEPEIILLPTSAR